MSAQITHVDPEETIRKLKAKVARLEKALAAQAAPVQTVAIPDNVRKIAKSMQKDGYRGPLSWARTVIDFVATYKSPPAAQPAPVPMTDEDVVILEAVRREMEDKVYSKNAPGHAHRTPGIWDEDNGDLAGKPCAWCLTWKKFTGLIEREAAHGITKKGQP